MCTHASSIHTYIHTATFELGWPEDDKRGGTHALPTTTQPLDLWSSRARHACLCTHPSTCCNHPFHADPAPPPPLAYCPPAHTRQDGFYGRQRMWASVGWGALSPAGGALLQRNGFGASFVAFALFSVPSLLALALLQYRAAAVRRRSPSANDLASLPSAQQVGRCCAYGGQDVHMSLHVHRAGPDPRRAALPCRAAPAAPARPPSIPRPGPHRPSCLHVRP